MRVVLTSCQEVRFLIWNFHFSRLSYFLVGVISVFAFLVLFFQIHSFSKEDGVKDSSQAEVFRSLDV